MARARGIRGRQDARARWLTWTVVLLPVLAAGGAALRAGAEAAPQVLAVHPAQTGDLVVCRLTTMGLPGERLLQSMESGLVAAVDLDVALLDTGQHPVQRGRLTLQLAFDLWEEVFAVRGGGQERRFADLAALRAFLAELEGVPVAPVAALDAGQRYRVEVGLRLHAIAPSQRRQVEEAIAGDRRPRRPGADEQELTVSLGRLIRLFYDDEVEPAVGTASSPWFSPEELTRAPH